MQSDDRLSMAVVYDAILTPRETTPVALCIHESPKSYLRKCRQNVLAELWGLYETKIRPDSPRWRDQNMDKLFLSVCEDFDCLLFNQIFEDRPNGCKRKETSDFHWTLVLWKDRLCLLLPNHKNPGELIVKEGKLVTDRYHSGGSDFFHVVGFIYPVFAELGAIMNFFENPDRSAMLRAVADPGTRSPFSFCKKGMCEFSDKVPINEPQRRIIETMAWNIECIQGPPGTGKSTTIFHIVQTAVPAGCHAIITCVQNKALDSVAEKLGLTDLPFIVYGNPSRLGDCAKHFTLEAQVARAPEVLHAKKALDVVEKLRSLIDGRINQILGLVSSSRWMRLWVAWVRRFDEAYLALVTESRSLLKKFHDLNEDLRCVSQTVSSQLTAMSRASLSTIDGLGSADIMCEQAVVIIDEAGTVPEYKLPLLLTMGVNAIVAIGDQNQLQPFSHARQDTPIDGFFQRAVKGLEGSVPMLTEQYRMHPSICNLVSMLFYKDKLVTGETVAGLRLAVPGGGISWRDYADLNAESQGKTKKWNSVEVDMVTAFMRQELPALLCEGKSVAILTFYKQQFLELMRVGEFTGVVKSREEMNRGKPQDTRFKNPNFRIMTVDAAQGSEADVVVLSCVRCNRQRSLGFITDKHRLCVALSRAREQLIVIGNKGTLCAVDRLWKGVERACKQ